MSLPAPEDHAETQFNPSTNKINVGMPAVYPKAPVNVTKGQLHKLF
jgi:hypothetical protein